MGILSRMFAPQAAITTSDGLWKELATYAGYGTAGSGITVTPQTALKCSAVYACVQVISQTVGQLPIVLYRRTAKGKEKAVNHPLFNLIGTKPNGFNNSMAFREMLTAHTALRGNSFAFINRVGNGRVYELLPLHPDCVGVYRDPWSWEITYTISQKKGINGVYTPKDVFHLMGMTLNGYSGVTPMTYARETIGLAMAAEKHGSKVFKNGAKPSGTLTTSGTLKDDAFKRLQEQLEEGYSGDNAHKTMILENGTTFAPVSITNEDLQYMLLRGFQVPEIARFYRMPLHKIQDMSASTNNNIEQQALEFLTDCMMPWFVRWESSLNTQLLTADEQKEYFFKFDVDDILRADMKSRFEAYSSGITSRIFNPNECREKEDMNPYDGGDEYINPAITQGAPEPVPDTTEQDKAAADQKQAMFDLRQQITALQASVMQKPITNNIETPAVTVNVTNQIPENPTPIVNVDNQVNVPEQSVSVNVPQQPAPVVNVNACDQPAPVVNIENIVNVPTSDRKVTIKRDKSGNMTGADITEE